MPFCCRLSNLIIKSYTGVLVERETHCYVYLVHIRGDKTHCRQECLFVAEDYCRVGCKPFLFFQTIDECRYITHLCHFGRCRNNRNVFRFFDIMCFEYCCRRELLHIFFDKLTCFYRRIVEKIFVVIPIVEALRAKSFFFKKAMTKKQKKLIK